MSHFLTHTLGMSCSKEFLRDLGFSARAVRQLDKPMSAEVRVTLEKQPVGMMGVFERQGKLKAQLAQEALGSAEGGAPVPPTPSLPRGP